MAKTKKRPSRPSKTKIVRAKIYDWRIVSLLIAALALFGFVVASVFAAPTTAVTVDFTQATAKTAPLAFSGTISTYGDGGFTIARTDANSQKTVANLKKLGLQSYRVPLRWNGGNIVSSAQGGGGGTSGEQWIKSIKGLNNAEPIVVVGGVDDNTIPAADAAALVQRFNKGGDSTLRVQRWIIGNEYKGDWGTFCTTIYLPAYRAMKAVDSTIQIGGPAIAYEDEGGMKKFYDCAKGNVEMLDWHDYADTSAADVAADARKNAVLVTKMRAYVNNPNIEIMVGEMNYCGGGSNCAPFGNGMDVRSTIWNTIAAGSVVKAGGRAHHYSDLNGRQGLVFDRTAGAEGTDVYGRQLADPLPAYRGYQMFTGGGLFRAFGTQMVQTTSNSPTVDVFASTNQKNIVLVNSATSPTQANIAITGAAAGTTQVWQTNKDKPFDAPVRLPDQPYSVSTISVSLAAQSVTTLILTEGGVAPTTTTTPVPTPTTTTTPPPSPTITPKPTTTVTPSPTTPATSSLAPGTYDDSSAAFSANWNSGTDAREYAGKDHYTSTSGATANIAFTGTSIELFGTLNSYHGYATVQIDNLPSETISYYGTSRLDQQRVFSKVGLSNSAHTLKLVATGQKPTNSGGTTITLDKFVIGNQLATTTPPTPSTTTTPKPTVTVTPVPTTPPPPPVAVTLLAPINLSVGLNYDWIRGNYGIQLGWQPVTSAARYTIQRNQQTIGTATNNSFTDSSIAPNQIYTYQVFANTTAGAQSPGSVVTSTSIRCFWIFCGLQ